MTIKYTDNYGKKKTMEIPDDTPVSVLEFLTAGERKLSCQRRKDTYQLERLDIPEEELYHRAVDKPIPFEEQYGDAVFENQLCKEALDVLMKYCTPIQRGRFYLHALYGIPTETIAYWQDCTDRAVRKSIHTVLELLHRYFQK